MQIRSPSVPCGGVDKQREMQKISTALAEDPVQVPGRVGHRSRLGLAGPLARVCGLPTVPCAEKQGPGDSAPG